MKNVTLLIFSLFISLFSFSQAGTYELCPIPAEGMSEAKNADGEYELPIYIGTATIKLTPGKKALYITDDDEKDKETTYGTWTSDKEIILISFEIESKMETGEFRIVTYKSGTYLKCLINNTYYKKVK